MRLPQMARRRVMETAKQGSALVEAARYPMAHNPTWASPTFLGTRLLVKDATALTLWELPT